jgi:hypothetical protein
MPRVATADRFGRALRKLSNQDRERTVSALVKFAETPELHGLNFEPIVGREGHFSIRAGLAVRIVSHRRIDEQGELFVAVDVGHHQIYRRR